MEVAQIRILGDLGVELNDLGLLSHEGDVRGLVLEGVVGIQVLVRGRSCNQHLLTIRAYGILWRAIRLNNHRPVEAYLIGL